MKIAILNDTHCGVRNSSDIFIKHQRDFYEQIFWPYLKDNNVTQILHLGDYYDGRKFINFKALNDNRECFLEKLREYGVTMDIIPGNHDVFYKNTNELCSLKELMGHYMNEINIIMDPKVMDYDGCKIAVLPWINNENYHESIEFVKNCKADFLGAHLELVGFEMMRGVKNTHGMGTEMFQKFEQVWSGHFHTKSQQGNIHYLGSQMEFTWADAHDPKYFHIFDTETRELTPVANTLNIFEKVVYNDSKIDYNSIDISKYKDKFVKVVVVKKEDPFIFDKFIDRINQLGVHDLKIAETFDEFVGVNVNDTGISVEDTTDLLNSYVDNVETDLDKGKIKELMRGLYVEAQNMELV
jgi:DNA repair exonuclease SbcCD nuclease subunit|tara:strand:+ start:16918 stop:17979 length:1062 start_codon:yes stop_codon:yes gene_type:complete